MKWIRSTAMYCISVLMILLSTCVLAQQTLYANYGPNIQIIAPDGTWSTLIANADNPAGLAFDANGTLFYVGKDSGSIHTFTQSGNTGIFATGLNQPYDDAFDADGNLYVSNFEDNTIRKITPDGIMSTFVTGMNGPLLLAFDAAGNLFVSNFTDGTISKITPAESISTVASGLNQPFGLAFNAYGNLYEANYGDGTIQKITPSGVISPFLSGLNGPEGLAFDTNGNLYIGNTGATDILKVTPTGTISIFAQGFPAGGCWPTFYPDISPALTGLSPSTVDAGGPAFAMTLKGRGFTNRVVVSVGGTVLKPAKLSATQLKVIVPASVISTPGKLSVMAINTGGATSNAKSLTILQTTLKLTAATLSYDATSQQYVAMVTFKNIGYLNAPSATITKATLGATSASNLPATVGTLTPGATATLALYFVEPQMSGVTTTLKVNGTFTGGTFSGSQKVILP